MTGQHLKIKRFGENALGVTLEGNPRKPEPIHFIVQFPGGEIEISRCDDGSYWVHTTCNDRERVIDQEGPYSGRTFGAITEARIHAKGKPSESPGVEGVYDLAVRVAKC